MLFNRKKKVYIVFLETTTHDCVLIAASSKLCKFLTIPTVPVRSNTKQNSGARVLTSEECIRMLEEKEMKKKTEAEAKERRKAEREERTLKKKKADTEKKEKRRAAQALKKKSSSIYYYYYACTILLHPYTCTMSCM